MLAGGDGEAEDPVAACAGAAVVAGAVVATAEGDAACAPLLAVGAGDCAAVDDAGMTLGSTRPACG